MTNVTFMSFKGFMDGSWFLFLLVAAISRSYGKNMLFKKMNIPTITGIRNLN